MLQSAGWWAHKASLHVSIFVVFIFYNDDDQPCAKKEKLPHTIVVDARNAAQVMLI